MRYLHKTLAVCALSLAALGLSTIAEAHDRYRDGYFSGGYFVYPGQRYYGRACRIYPYGYRYQRRYGYDRDDYPRRHHHRRPRHHDHHSKRHDHNDRKVHYAANRTGRRF